MDSMMQVHHHCLWQVELLQLPQEVHSLLSYFGEGADVQLPLEVLGDDGAQKAEGLRSVDWGVSQGDGGGEDGLDDAGVEVHHHCLWQVKLLQLPQKVHPLLSSFGEGADVQPPLEVLGDDGAQEAEGLRSVDWVFVCFYVYCMHLYIRTNSR